MDEVEIGIRLIRAGDTLTKETDVDRTYRILWLANGDERYGVGTAMLNLMSVMKSHGHDVRALIFRDGYFTDRCAEMGIPTVRLSSVDGLVQFSGSIPQRFNAILENNRRIKLAVKEAVTELSDWQPQIVHFLWPTMVNYGGQLARALNAKPIWEMANTVNPKSPLAASRRYYTYLCNRYGIKVLSNSQHTADSVKSSRLQPTVFHLNTDDERFDPDKVKPVRRQELGLPEDAIVMGIMSRICADKGQDRIVKAMANGLAKDFPKLHLLLLGGPLDDAFAQGLRDVMNQAGIADRVHMPGPVTDPERYFGVMDFSINSRVSPEPFGLSVTESMMMRTPVLATGSGGPAETILEGQTGWFAPEPTAKGFEIGIRKALEDQPRWPEMRERAHAHAMQHFSREAIYGRYIDAIRSVL